MVNGKKIGQNSLLADAPGNPDERHGTDYGRTDGTQDASPCDAELLECPAAETAAEESENEVLDEAVAFATHNPARYGACYDANDDSFYHNNE